MDAGLLVEEGAVQELFSRLLLAALAGVALFTAHALFINLRQSLYFHHKPQSFK